MEEADRVPPLRVLSVAALHWSAGYDHLLLGLRHLLDGGRLATLRVEATGPARERFLFTVHDLGLASVVTLVPAHDAGAETGADVLALAAVVDMPWPEVLVARRRVAAIVATDLPWARAHLAPGPPPADLAPVRSARALAEALARVGPPVGP